MKIKYEVGDRVIIDRGQPYEKKGVILSVTPRQMKCVVIVDGDHHITLARYLTPNFDK